MGTRWLGVGLAAALAVVTLGLAVTGRLGLYINPESSWFAVAMAVLLLIGAALSFLLPLGAETDHGHDHGDDHDHDEHGSSRSLRLLAQRPGAAVATATGGVLASGVVAAVLLLPPASLSAELAMSRTVGSAPLFAGADTVALATTGDTKSFGVGDWASVFATATNPDAFEGDAVTLTGFVTAAAGSDGFELTRLVITHCVIDAQSASVPVAASGNLRTGQWVTVTGTVRSAADGTLEVSATGVQTVDEPADPYEY